MAGSIPYGPTPWWQAGQKTPGELAATAGTPLTNLQNQAPSGYEYNPVTMSYNRTPTSAGTRANEFTSAALGGSLPSLSGLASGGSSSTGISGVGGVGGTGTGGSSAAGGGGTVAPIQPPDMTGSNNAVFAAAKDKVGQQSRASLDALNGELGAQGMLGSGAQVQGARDIISSGAGELGQVTRDQATSDANRDNQFAAMGYQGNITQRGQDIAAQDAQARLALQKNQQQYQLLDLMLRGIGGSNSTAAGAGLLY